MIAASLIVLLMVDKRDAIKPTPKRFPTIVLSNMRNNPALNPLITF